MQRGRRKGLRFLFDRNTLFSFNRLVQTIAPLAAFHEAACELINDHHLPIFDDIVHIAFVEVTGFERVIDQVGPFHVSRGVKAFHTSQFFGFAYTFVGERYVVLLFIHFEVVFACQLARDAIRLFVAAKVEVSGATDDQRCTCFIDQNVVDFVDDREIQWSLALLGFCGEPVITF